MRYTLINGLLLLAVSPFSALALPVDPNDHTLSNQNRQGWTDRNGQWHPSNQNQNGQGWTDANGQWHANNQGQNGQGWTDANGQWHANQKRAVDPAALNGGGFNNGGLQNGGFAPTGTTNNQKAGNQNGANPLAQPGAPAASGAGGIPGIKTRNWPSDHNNQNDQGWTDRNGQWHPSNHNQNGQGWTDANGQWHRNNQGQNGQGWTDQNGQWHANQKRDWRDDGYNRNDDYNRDDSYPSDHHRESYLDRAADRATDDILSSPSVVRRWWPFTNWHHDNDSNRDCDRNDWNCRNRDNYNSGHGYNDKCKENDRSDRSGWSCRHDWDRYGATPTPRAFVARHSPHENNEANGVNDVADTPAVQDNNSINASATPTAQHGEEQKYNKDQDQETNQNLEQDLKNEKKDD